MDMITTNSGFSFTPPENVLDNWDFVSTMGRMVSNKSGNLETMSAYFDMAEILLGADGLERLKAHVKAAKGYVSFSSMTAELSELVSKLKESEGNSSSLPE